MVFMKLCASIFIASDISVVCIVNIIIVVRQVEKAVAMTRKRALRHGNGDGHQEKVFVTEN
jgi:hypothetical protein